MASMDAGEHMLTMLQSMRNKLERQVSFDNIKGETHSTYTLLGIKCPFFLFPAEKRWILNHVIQKINGYFIPKRA